MTDEEEGRARLVRRADVMRSRLLRVIDALGRKTTIQMIREPRRMIAPARLVAIAAVGVGGVLYAIHRARQHRAHLQLRLPAVTGTAFPTRPPLHLEIVRSLVVSLATFVVGTIAKRYAAKLMAARESARELVDVDDLPELPALTH